MRQRAAVVVVVGLFAAVVAVGMLSSASAAGAPRNVGASAAPAAFPQDPPNDPNYDPAEKGGLPTCLQTSVNDEQHQLYSFMPQCTPLATDPENASGMSVDQAWATRTTGDPAELVAYIEGGINWHLPDAAKELADKVFINTGELPPPEAANGDADPSAPVGGYDLDHNGTVNAADYGHDPRVRDSNGNGLIDPEDLIVAFSSWCTTGGTWHHDPQGCAGVDNDGNGFAHDISGWDFYDHQNDPATVDSTYDHSDNQMRVVGAQTDNGVGGAGICPRCMIVPIKAGAEALDRTDDLAQAWLYADNIGAKVVVSVTADLGYSSYMRQAVNKLWHDGVIMLESSNDFDSTDHQGGMFWPHVVPGNGLVPNTVSLLTNPPELNALTTTYRERSNETSWGTHAMFSVPTQKGSTSESTPTTGGALALIQSWGDEQAAAGHLAGGPLTGPEVIQLTRATASAITNPNLGWPGSPGDWNLQYGYGRPNVLKAMEAIDAGDIPPVAWIDSPEWYALYDPTVTSTVPVSGHVEARRSSGYHWELQYAAGAQPTDAQWMTAATGSGAQSYTGHLGDLDLSRIPESFWAAAHTISTTKELETNEQYTVSIRVRVTDANGRVGEERRTIAVHHDPSIRSGFPVKLPAGSASQPALVDLQGVGHLAAVFGDADGNVHAVDGLTGNELPGFPVQTDPTVPQRQYPGIDPGHEPILAPLAVGDLFHDGNLEIVATSTTGTTYVWDAHGHRLPRWPKPLDGSVVTPPIPRPAMPFTRLAHRGATASPVLVDLTGNHQLDIVQGAWDGNVYAWHPDGSAVPGWPVHVTVGSGYKPPAGKSLVDDQKIDTTPGVAYFDGPDKPPSLVVRSQYSDVLGAGVQPLGDNKVFAFHADGTPVAGWPVSLPAVIMYYGSAQEFITEGANAPAAADVDGDGHDEVSTGPAFAPAYLLDGSGQLKTLYGPVGNPLAGLLTTLSSPAGLEALLKGTAPLPTDAPVSFTTSGAFGRFGVDHTLGYASAGSGTVSTALALLLPGSGTAIANFETGFDAATGVPKVGFPQKFQGLDFLGSPVIADVSGDGSPEVVDGGDTSTMHAYTSTGAQAPNFPKFTTGWVLFSPSAGDLSSDGHTDLVTTTREGYLYAWATPGTYAGDQEWWTYHHDEWRTGRYGTDTRPPGTLRDVHWTPGATSATFVAPGDDWYDGKADHYTVTVDGHATTVAASAAAGEVQHLTIPAGAQKVVVQAVDDAGNLGPAVSLASPTTPPGGNTKPPGRTAPPNQPGGRHGVLAYTGLDDPLVPLAVIFGLGAIALFAVRRRAHRSIR